MGTPAFAVPSLEALIAHHEVVAVVTQPDKPKGRGKKMVYPPVKETALAHGIPVFQPNKVKDAEVLDVLKRYHPDVIAVVAYGQILPVEILELPKYGCINVHGSLLPAYRGAAPMQWAVINGEIETGITTMYMAAGLDSGDMLLKRSVPIALQDTYGMLHDTMMVVGAELLIETLDGLEKGKIKAQPQEHEKATYAPMLTKETGHIDWNKTTDEIICLIRGLNPAPGAYTFLEDEPIKIWKAEKSEGKENAAKGEIIEINKHGFVVQAGDGGLKICELQAQGGKKMDAGAYLRGHQLQLGQMMK